MAGTKDIAISTATPAIAPVGATGTFAVVGTEKLPAGLILNADTGEISGTPTSVTGVAVSVTIRMTGTTDYAGQTAEADVSITIIEADRLPGSPGIGGYVAGDGQVEITWAAPSDTGIAGGSGVAATIDKYTVYWGAGTGVDTSSTNKADVTDATTYTITSLDDSALPNDAPVYFIVTATSAKGESPASEEGTATPSAAVIDVATVIFADKKTANVALGETLKLKADVSPIDASNKKLLWSSSDESVATVDASGLVTSQSAGGPVAITVKSEADETKLDSIQITVDAISVSSLSYSSDVLSATISTEITQLTPTADPPAATGVYSVEPALPGGLNIDEVSGIISGTPTAVTAAGTYRVSFAGNGNYDGIVYRDVTISVDAKAISFIDYDALAVTKDVEILAVIPAIAPVGATGTFAIIGTTDLPLGLELNPDTGVISGTPTSLTSRPIEVKIQMTGTNDYLGITTSDTVKITVSEGDRAPGAPAIAGYVAGDGQVTVTWTAPSDAGIINGNGTVGTITKYTVYWGATTGFDIDAAKTAEVTTGNTSYTITSLTTDAPVYFVVTASNATGESQPSAEESTTPTATDNIIDATGVVIADTSVTDIIIGETLQLSVDVTPANASSKEVTWSSSVPAVATVNGSGLVTPKPQSVGETAVISVALTTANTNISDSITITVVGIPVDSLNYSSDTLSGTIGTAFTELTELTPRVRPDGATGTYRVNPALPNGLGFS